MQKNAVQVLRYIWRPIDASDFKLKEYLFQSNFWLKKPLKMLLTLYYSITYSYIFMPLHKTAQFAVKISTKPIQLYICN